MTRLEMIQKLIENPKRIAIQTKTSGGRPVDATYHVNDYGRIVDEDDDSIAMYAFADESEWDVVEPKKKLKQMNYGEAMYALIHSPNPEYGDWFYSDLKSVVTGYDAERAWEDVTKEEFLGLWTVEGVYED